MVGASPEIMARLSGGAITLRVTGKMALERESLPDCLEVSAESEEGEIMGLRHRTLPVEGVQFHPEAMLTEHGHAMLKNFLEWRTQ